MSRSFDRNRGGEKDFRKQEEKRPSVFDRLGARKSSESPLRKSKMKEKRLGMDDDLPKSKHKLKDCTKKRHLTEKRSKDNLSPISSRSVKKARSQGKVKRAKMDSKKTKRMPNARPKKTKKSRKREDSTSSTSNDSTSYSSSSSSSGRLSRSTSSSSGKTSSSSSVPSIKLMRSERLSKFRGPPDANDNDSERHSRERHSSRKNIKLSSDKKFRSNSKSSSRSSSISHDSKYKSHRHHSRSMQKVSPLLGNQSDLMVRDSREYGKEKDSERNYRAVDEFGEESRKKKHGHLKDEKPHYSPEIRQRKSKKTKLFQESDSPPPLLMRRAPLLDTPRPDKIPDHSGGFRNFDADPRSDIRLVPSSPPSGRSFLSSRSEHIDRCAPPLEDRYQAKSRPRTSERGGHTQRVAPARHSLDNMQGVPKPLMDPRDAPMRGRGGMRRGEFHHPGDPKADTMMRSMFPRGPHVMRGMRGSRPDMFSTFNRRMAPRFPNLTYRPPPPTAVKPSESQPNETLSDKSEDKLRQSRVDLWVDETLKRPSPKDLFSPLKKPEEKESGGNASEVPSGNGKQNQRPKPEKLGHGSEISDSAEIMGERLDVISGTEEICSDVSDDEDIFIKGEEKEEITEVNASDSVEKKEGLMVSCEKETEVERTSVQKSSSDIHRDSEDENDSLLLTKMDFEEISEEELEDGGSNIDIVDALGVDWSSLVCRNGSSPSSVSGSPLSGKNITGSNSEQREVCKVRERWTPVQVIKDVGVSMELLGPKIFDQVVQKIKQASFKAGEEINEEEIQNPLLRRKRRERKNILDNVGIGSYSRALCSKRELVMRKYLMEIPQKDLIPMPISSII